MNHSKNKEKLLKIQMVSENHTKTKGHVQKQWSLKKKNKREIAKGTI